MTVTLTYMNEVPAGHLAAIDRIAQRFTDGAFSGGVRAFWRDVSAAVRAELNARANGQPTAAVQDHELDAALMDDEERRQLVGYLQHAVDAFSNTDRPTAFLFANLRTAVAEADAREQLARARWADFLAGGDFHAAGEQVAAAEIPDGWMLS